MALKFVPLVGFMFFVLGACLRSERAPSATENLASALQQRGLALYGVEKFQVRQISQMPSGPTLLRAENEDGTVLKARFVPAADHERAERYLRGQMNSIELLFNPTVSPYIGNVTKEQSCPKSLRPKVVKKGTFEILAVPTGERLNMGVCEKAELVYSGYLAFFYESSRQRVIQIEFYFPQAASSDLLEEVLTKVPATIEGLKISLSGEGT